MVKGYKYINIKEVVVNRIRDLEENRKEIEEDKFNLAGFVSRVLLEYMNKDKTTTQVNNEALDLNQIKNALKEVLNEKKEGNIITDIGTGLTKQDLKGLKDDIQARAYAGAKEAISDAMNTH